MFRQLTALVLTAGLGLATAAPEPARADPDAGRVFVGVLAGVAAVALLSDAFDHDHYYRPYRPRVSVRTRVRIGAPYWRSRPFYRPRVVHRYVHTYRPRTRVIHRNVYRPSPRLHRAERVRRHELRREHRRRTLRRAPRTRVVNERRVRTRTTRTRVVRERRNSPRDTFMGR